MAPRLIFALFLLATLFLGLASASPDGPKTSKHAREVLATTKKRLAAIREELGHVMPHPWAGEYVRGASPGAVESLAIAPGSGFASLTHDAVGLVEWSYGRVYELGDRVVFVSEETSAESDEARSNTQLLVVPWGERRYLLFEHEIAEFCDAVNRGIEPALDPKAGSPFLIRKGDLTRPVTGRPGVPPEFVPLLLERSGPQGAPGTASPLSRNGKPMA